MASDDFTGDNDTALATHDSNWASIGETGTSNRFAVGGYEIQSNQCQATGTFTYAGGRYTASTDVNFSEVIIRASDHTNANVNVCIQATAARRGYHTRFQGLSGDIFSTIQLREDDGSSNTFRASTGSLSIDRTADIKVKIQIVGDDVLVYIDDVLRITWEDLTPLTGGDPGFCQQNSINALVPMDDWTDGAAGAAGNPWYYYANQA